MTSRKMLFLSLILNVILLIGILVMCIHYHWIDRFQERIGLKDRPCSQDYLTTISWNHTMQSLSYEADVVFFGASLTSDGHWEDYFDSLKICNLGKSGDRLDMMLWRVPQITAVHPKKVFLSMEQNDMHILTINEIEKAYNTLIDTIVQTNPQAKLYLESLTPLNERQFRRVCDNVKIRKVNELIERVAKERGFTYIDIYSIYEQDGQLSMSISTDGQHLVPEAYLKWTEAIKPFLN